MHILRGPHVRHERHKPPVPPVRQHQARFLPHLAQQHLRAFALLALAAYTDPLALVFVVGLFGAVQHQAAASLFDVAQRRILHCRPRAQKFPPFQPQLGRFGVFDVYPRGVDVQHGVQQFADAGRQCIVGVRLRAAVNGYLHQRGGGVGALEPQRALGSTPTISQASLLPGMASMACPSRVLSASCAFSDTGILVFTLMNGINISSLTRRDRRAF